MKKIFFIFVCGLLSFVLINCGTEGENFNINFIGKYSGEIKIYYTNNLLTSFSSDLYISKYNENYYVVFTGDTTNKLLSVYNLVISQNSITGNFSWYNDTSTIVISSLNLTSNGSTLIGTASLADNRRMSFSFDKINSANNYFVPYQYNISVDGDSSEWTINGSKITDTIDNYYNGADFKGLKTAQDSDYVYLMIESVNRVQSTDTGSGSSDTQTSLTLTGTKFVIDIYEDLNRVLSFEYYNSSATIKDSNDSSITNSNYSVASSNVIEFKLPKDLIINYLSNQELVSAYIKISSYREINSLFQVQDTMNLTYPEITGLIKLNFQ